MSGKLSSLFFVIEFTNKSPIKAGDLQITVLLGRAGQRFGFGSDRLSVAIGLAAAIVSAADCAGHTAAVCALSQTITARKFRDACHQMITRINGVMNDPGFHT